MQSPQPSNQFKPYKIEFLVPENIPLGTKIICQAALDTKIWLFLYLVAIVDCPKTAMLVNLRNPDFDSAVMFILETTIRPSGISSQFVTTVSWSTSGDIVVQC